LEKETGLEAINIKMDYQGRIETEIPTICPKD
jgi:hypothetical protein